MFQAMFLRVPFLRSPRRVIGARENVAEYAGANLSGRINFKRGTGNAVRIGEGSKVPGKITIQGNGNTVEIGRKCEFRGNILIKGDGQKVVIGDETTTVGVYILVDEGCDVHIGRRCMFSREIEIRTTDAHSLIDRATGERINPGRSIFIGDHVWVGVGAIINKGAIVPADSVVGAMAFVNGTFEEGGTVIAGVPAKVVRRGVTWNRARRAAFSEDEMDSWRW